MIRYNNYDLPLYDMSIKILKYFGGDEPDETDVWVTARESESVPNFENILQTQVFSQIEHLMAGCTNLKCSYFVNARDTQFYLIVDGQSIPIRGYAQFKELYVENR